MFTTAPNHYESNLEHDRTITASPALITTPDREHEPGVAVFTRRRVVAVISPESAKGLALELADAIDAHDRRTKVRRDTAVNAAFADLADR
ncbi:hypothetical protein GCM10011374_11720 [Kocuria dechangensis]|uniref:Uncharacterized protein n=1 Tax=Kocuria dechangensis TaxID=1176249 RepID=A0A917GLU9_9MICC|nr:hypothetical protein [Kocuria dechangensis]GGG50774.1 hypothetical protein GCM10011374_11720 [Kocuria dechangensis]